MAEREQVYTNMENAVRLYVNSVQVAQSAFDLRLLMGTMDVADAERVVTHVEAIVFMSLPHAKVLANILQKQIEKHEARMAHENRPVESVEDMLSREEG